MRFDLTKTVQSSLCLGCGLCEGLGAAEGVVMQEGQSGFYEPILPGSMSGKLRKELGEFCPGVNVECIDNKETFCGHVEAAYEGWSNEEEIRRKASSGGIITALACYLLRTQQVTAVLQVGVREGDFLHNELKVSRTEEEVMSCASSRYAPALMFHKLPALLAKKDEIYLFVGKPCDVMTLKKYMGKHPEYSSRIRYFLSLVCAGMPSYNASWQLIHRAGNPTSPVELKYRGDGWPGDFKVRFQNGGEYHCSYNDSWGKVLGRSVQFRCKICPDGIGQWSDLVVGDAWHTVDGYPDFREQDGKSFILARTQKGKDLLESAFRDNTIMLRKMDLNRLPQMQPYQYLRLKSVFYRLVPAWFLTKGRLKIHRLRIPWFNPVKGCRISAGTIYRFYKRTK